MVKQLIAKLVHMSDSVNSESDNDNNCLKENIGQEPAKNRRPIFSHISLTVKLETTHKPSKPPTNQPNHRQTSQIPDKPTTNQPKIASFP